MQEARSDFCNKKIVTIEDTVYLLQGFGPQIELFSECQYLLKVCGNTRSESAQSRHANKNVFSYTLKTGKRKFMILIIYIDPKKFNNLTPSYQIYVFEVLAGNIERAFNKSEEKREGDRHYKNKNNSTNILFFVAYRDLEAKSDSLAVYKDASNSDPIIVNFVYFGNWLTTSVNYRRQDMLLFLFFIYAIILEFVEKINSHESSGRRVVALQILDKSSISIVTKHEACAYCNYFFPTSRLVSSNNNIVPLPRKLPIYVGRSSLKKVKHNNIRWQESKVISRNDGPHSYKTVGTFYHLYIPSAQGALLLKVFEKYTQKLQKFISMDKEPSLGIQLMTAAEISKASFFRKLSRWANTITPLILHRYGP